MWKEIIMTIYLQDGTKENIFKNDDYFRLVYDRLGSDCADYIKDIIKELQEAKNDVDFEYTRAEELESDYSILSDENDKLEHELNEIKSNIDAVRIYILENLETKIGQTQSFNFFANKILEILDQDLF